MQTSHEDRSAHPDNPLKLILVVEDDFDVGHMLVDTIKQETSYHALLATNGEEALRITRHLQCHLFLLDYHLPGLNGIQLFDQLAQASAHADARAILMTASTRVSHAELEQRPHIIFMSKPTDQDLLTRTIHTFMEAE